MTVALSSTGAPEWAVEGRPERSGGDPNPPTGAGGQPRHRPSRVSDYANYGGRGGRDQGEGERGRSRRGRRGIAMRPEPFPAIISWRRKIQLSAHIKKYRLGFIRWSTFRCISRNLVVHGEKYSLSCASVPEGRVPSLSLLESSECGGGKVGTGGGEAWVRGVRIPHPQSLPTGNGS